MQMAAQGQSIFSAAGDTGANDNGSTLSIDDPSGQPYMTAVGGTTLTTVRRKLRQRNHLVRRRRRSELGLETSGYQQGVSMSANKGSTTMRNIPDVSVNADSNTGYDIYQSGGWGTWGGTSAAAPIWAAFTALVNQQR